MGTTKVSSCLCSSTTENFSRRKMSRRMKFLRKFMKISFIVILTMFIVHKLPRCNGDTIKWLSLSSALPTLNEITPNKSPSANPNSKSPPKHMCDKFSSSLVGKQIQFCRKHPEFMRSVASGASKAVNECQFQFRTRRWNCSALNVVDDKETLPIHSRKGKRSNQNLTDHSESTNEHRMTLPDASQKAIRKQLQHTKHIVGKYPIVPAGTRESAFVHAISAAGVAHAVTKSCSSGESPECGCDRTMAERVSEATYADAVADASKNTKGSGKELASSFKWAGCSDNIDYGVSLSRSFVDARDQRLSRKRVINRTANTAKALMNLHNNEAGRKIMMGQVQIDCKCHGVSGSCEIKTCWRVMLSFRKIGEILNEKFENAYHVEEKKVGTRRVLAIRNKYSGKSLTDSDLVYTRRSPDFCELDVKKGSLGTQGRRCNKQSTTAIDACSQLCCSRGYTTEKVKKSVRCRCKFQWCCTVSCDVCPEIEEVTTCK